MKVNLLPVVSSLRSSPTGYKLSFLRNGETSLPFLLTQNVGNGQLVEAASKRMIFHQRKRANRRLRFARLNSVASSA
jgi:hypothetical protein